MVEGGRSAPLPPTGEPLEPTEPARPPESSAAVTGPDVTPMMRQYREWKRRYPDYLLLFRLGDFYEAFYEDAATAARLLGITLTSRQKGDGAIPMAGVPHHAVETYIARLVRAGLKIAICDQVESAPAKGRKLLRPARPPIAARMTCSGRLAVGVSANKLTIVAEHSGAAAWA